MSGNSRVAGHNRGCAWQAAYFGAVAGFTLGIAVHNYVKEECPKAYEQCDEIYPYEENQTARNATYYGKSYCGGHTNFARNKCALFGALHLGIDVAVYDVVDDAAAGNNERVA